ncbi:MAG: TolC family protein [Candidatus Obscuribacterales bacterium]|nr:TolC family protein [Candidatus Obscuribacterales bacterium]
MQLRVLSVFVLIAMLTTCISFPASAAYSTDAKELPEVGSAPLTARVNLDIRDVKQQERFRVALPPILIDAKKTEPLTLESVLNLAAHRNLSYLQTRWLGRSANLAFLGSVGAMNAFNYGEAGSNLGLFTDAAAGQPFGTNSPIERQRYYTYGATLSTGGTTFISMMNNFFKSRVLAANVRTSLQDTLFEASNNYFTLCRDISLLHVNDIVVENSKGIRDLNQGLLDSGMGTRLQLLQAQTQLAQDRQQLVLQQAQARIAAIKLAVTLNLPLSCYILPQTRPLAKTILVDPKLNVETLVQLALQQRPEITRLRNQVKLDISQATQALTPLIPTASYTVTSGEFFPANNQSNLIGVQRNMQINWNLNNLGAPILPNLASGLATARSDQYALRNVELQVRSEVRQSYDNCLAYETNIGIAKEAAAQAQEQLKLAEERLKAGIGINIDVIQAQTALTAALRNYVNAVYSYNIEQAKLRRAIGGFNVKALSSKIRYE